MTFSRPSQKKPSLSKITGQTSKKIYKNVLSPFLHWIAGPGYGCRFYPTCGDYAGESIERYGMVRGGFIALKRVSKCHPWGGQGYDPVP